MSRKQGSHLETYECYVCGNVIHAGIEDAKADGWVVINEDDTDIIFCSVDCKEYLKFL